MCVCVFVCVCVPFQCWFCVFIIVEDSTNRWMKRPRPRCVFDARGLAKNIQLAPWDVFLTQHKYLYYPVKKTQPVNMYDK